MRVVRLRVELAVVLAGFSHSEDKEEERCIRVGSGDKGKL